MKTNKVNGMSKFLKLHRTAELFIDAMLSANKNLSLEEEIQLGELATIKAIAHENKPLTLEDLREVRDSVVGYFDYNENDY